MLQTLVQEFNSYYLEVRLMMHVRESLEITGEILKAISII